MGFRLPGREFGGCGTALSFFIQPRMIAIDENATEEGCKDEKNTVRLPSHASNPVHIRLARLTKSAQPDR
jgi:hypothetical protein